MTTPLLKVSCAVVNTPCIGIGPSGSSVSDPVPLTTSISAAFGGPVPEQNCSARSVPLYAESCRAVRAYVVGSVVERFSADSLTPTPMVSSAEKAHTSALEQSLVTGSITGSIVVDVGWNWPDESGTDKEAGIVSESGTSDVVVASGTAETALEADVAAVLEPRLVESAHALSGTKAMTAARARVDRRMKLRRLAGRLSSTKVQNAQMWSGSASAGIETQGQQPKAPYAGRSPPQIAATESRCRSAAARTKTTTASNA
ncbi:MAG: hypothetical protein JWL72_2598 [Ilumatobacteraceae bacterium]|nr:hypothetical protein [Ilumatobacteraceae bacterium]